MDYVHVASQSLLSNMSDYESMLQTVRGTSNIVYYIAKTNLDLKLYSIYNKSYN